ncbi:MAG: FAD-dependent oxidoreductase [Saprospiraceae bacterium]|nr:FAD-dependent oxidoreductase [Saprospiraceae bacterium]
MKRRNFLKNTVVTSIGATALSNSNFNLSPYQLSSDGQDIVVIGAGVFGVWAAYHLQKSGAEVTLVDAYGPGNARASSGGESRILRSDYGDRLMYSRMNIRSFDLWTKYQEEWNASFMYPSGRLTFYDSDAEPRLKKVQSSLKELGVVSEILKGKEIQYRWPQVNASGIDLAVYYAGGVGGSSLMAREACRVVSEQFEKIGGKLIIGRVQAIPKKGSYDVSMENGEKLVADKYIFACGPWMGKVFPEIFAERLNVYRRDVFFIGTPAGDNRFSHPQLPIFSFNNKENSRYYGMPDLRGLGVKFAPWPDLNSIDMDFDDRMNHPIEVNRLRNFLSQRFPELVNQPIVGGKVCQLTMNEDSHFIIDHHPDDSKIWFACSGSGHAFKHGPALGEYISNRILNNTSLPEYDEAFRLKKV